VELVSAVFTNLHQVVMVEEGFSHEHGGLGI
jgi:hypothetical protein